MLREMNCGDVILAEETVPRRRARREFLLPFDQRASYRQPEKHDFPAACLDARDVLRGVTESSLRRLTHHLLEFRQWNKRGWRRHREEREPSVRDALLQRAADDRGCRVHAGATIAIE